MPSEKRESAKSNMVPIESQDNCEKKTYVNKRNYMIDDSGRKERSNLHSVMTLLIKRQTDHRSLFVKLPYFDTQR